MQTTHGAGAPRARKAAVDIVGLINLGGPLKRAAWQK